MKGFMYEAYELLESDTDVEYTKQDLIDIINKNSVNLTVDDLFYTTPNSKLVDTDHVIKMVNKLSPIKINDNYIQNQILAVNYVDTFYRILSELAFTGNIIEKLAPVQFMARKDFSSGSKKYVFKIADGKHRIALAKLLGISKVPVEIMLN